jgi:hypothetical protein
MDRDGFASYPEHPESKPSSHPPEKKKRKSAYEVIEDVPYCETADDAEAKMKAHFGARILRFDHSSKKSESMQYRKWRCCKEGCPFICRIRKDNATGLWVTETKGVAHIHHTDDSNNSSTNVSDEWGLPPEFKLVICNMRIVAKDLFDEEIVPAKAVMKLQQTF